MLSQTHPNSLRGPAARAQLVLPACAAQARTPAPPVAHRHKRTVPLTPAPLPDPSVPTASHPCCTAASQHTLPTCATHTSLGTPFPTHAHNTICTLRTASASQPRLGTMCPGPAVSLHPLPTLPAPGCPHPPYAPRLVLPACLLTLLCLSPATPCARPHTLAASPPTRVPHTQHTSSLHVPASLPPRTALLHAGRDALHARSPVTSQPLRPPSLRLTPRLWEAAPTPWLRQTPHVMIGIASILGTPSILGIHTPGCSALCRAVSPPSLPS